MNTGIYFPLSAILFSLLLIFAYFSKEKIDTEETHVYGWLIIVNFFALIIELLCSWASTIYATYPFLSNCIYKTYLACLILWISIFTHYIYYLLYDSTNIKLHMIYKYIILFGIIIIYFLPIELVLLGGKTGYTTGLSVYYSYYFAGVLIFVSILMILMNLKRALTKKFLPLYFLIVFGSIATILQIFSPGLLILSYIECFVVSVMYHTIENPDVKTIEQLNQAKDAAIKANQAKSDFLSSMSHEIRTPLNAICGFSNSLLENDGVSEEAKVDVKNIIMASDSLLDLVNGILDISKIEANKLEIIETNYNFYKIFDELVLLTKARIGDKPLEFKYSYDESIPKYLYGDGMRVKQVILNLLTNSVKYTKEGFVEFRVRSVIKDNIVRLIISVEDSGIGIKQENIEKLFTKFERLGVEKETTTEGTGLGLAITKKLVEMMGGKVAVQSIYGQGSLFTLSIDQKIVSGNELEKLLKEEATEVKASDEVVDASGKKVLVVDDNQLNLRVAERLLKAYKCDIECVSSGSECITKIVNGEIYDLILLDDMMPKMSGSETLIKLKEIDNFNIPVCVLTANAITGMREEYLSKGFNDYLSKPIVKEELNRVIKKYLKK